MLHKVNDTHGLTAVREIESFNFFKTGTQVRGWQVNQPYVISDDSVSLIAGDRVLFDWRAQGVVMQCFAFLLEENTGNTIELLDANAPRAGALAVVM